MADRAEQLGAPHQEGAADLDAGGGIPGPMSHPLGSVVGMVGWSLRFAPELLTGTARLLVNPPRMYRRMRGHSRTAGTLGASLDGMSGHTALTPSRLSVARRLAFDRGRNRVVTGVPYGPAPGQTLDIWRGRDVDPAGSAPVLVYIPGGGWVHGTTRLQGNALLGHLAEAGWVCVGVNYRVSPAFRWPTHLYDVKRALGWVHRTIGEYGGDPERVAIAGASAGGHLAALAGLTPGDRSLQPGFENDRTDVSAVVGLYGRYDWEARDTLERKRFMMFLEKVVVGERQEDNPEVFAAASPMSLVGPGTPPFFVIHGRSDAIIPVAQARAFVDRLRESSNGRVVYAELPGTGHGFDIVDPLRATIVARAVERFLQACDEEAPASSDRLRRRGGGCG